MSGRKCEVSMHKFIRTVNPHTHVWRNPYDKTYREDKVNFRETRCIEGCCS